MPFPAVKPGLAGAFPSVVGKPTGPIVITHTHNDLACTIAYALASRLSRDITQGIGDASDEFGAMGANGPQKLDPGAAEPDDTTLGFRAQAGQGQHVPSRPIHRQDPRQSMPTTTSPIRPSGVSLP